MDLDRWNQIGLSVLMLIICVQPSIIQEIISYVDCKQLDPFSSATYINSFSTTQCYTPSYNTFLYNFIIPTVLFWAVAIPSGLFLVLFLKKKKLNSKPMRITFGAIYNEYRQTSYYWGVLIMVFKVVLLVLTKMFGKDANLKAMIILLFFYFYKKLFTIKRPYYFKGLLLAERLALYSYICTVWFTLLFKDNERWIQVACLIVIATTNTATIGFIAWKIFKLTKEIIVSKVSAVGFEVNRSKKLSRGKSFAGRAFRARNFRQSIEEELSGEDQDKNRISEGEFHSPPTQDASNLLGYQSMDSISIQNHGEGPSNENGSDAKTLEVTISYRKAQTLADSCNELQIEQDSIKKNNIDANQSQGSS